MTFPAETVILPTRKFPDFPARFLNFKTPGLCTEHTRNRSAALGAGVRKNPAGSCAVVAPCRV